MRLLSHIVIVGYLLLGGLSAWSDDISLQQEQAREQIDTILANDLFNEKDIKTGWRLKNIIDNEDDNIQWLVDFVKWLEGRGVVDSSDSSNDWSDAIVDIAVIIEVVFWLIFTGLIIYLIYHFRDAIGRRLPIFRKAKTTEMPATVAGFDVSKESLPDDVIQTAQQFWNTQHYRQAVGLLYRASLSNLLHDHECRLLGSFTEQECLDAASNLQPSLFEYMQKITRSWQQLAYAHQAPAADQFQQHCTQWEQVFRPVEQGPEQ